jgi:hypothetical protein
MGTTKYYVNRKQKRRCEDVGCDDVDWSQQAHNKVVRFIQRAGSAVLSHTEIQNWKFSAL